MVTVTHETTVSASPGMVWAVLADFSSIAGWAQDVDHSCPLTQRLQGVGAERRVQAKSNVLLERVTVWQPEKALAYEIVGAPAVVSSIVNNWSLTADGDHTNVALTCQVEPGPKPPMKLAARFIARLCGSVNQRLLRDLAAAAARAATATATTDGIEGS